MCKNIFIFSLLILLSTSLHGMDDREKNMSHFFGDYTYNLDDAFTEDDLQHVENMLKKKTLKANDTLDDEPLIFHARSVKMAQLLLNYGAQLDVISRTRGTLLHHTANNWTDIISADLLQFYIEQQPNHVNLQCPTHAEEEAPLHILCSTSLTLCEGFQKMYENRIACIQHLINAGADCTLKNRDKKTPLDIAQGTCDLLEDLMPDDPDVAHTDMSQRVKCALSYHKKILDMVQDASK